MSHEAHNKDGGGFEESGRCGDDTRDRQFVVMWADDVIYWAISL